MERAEIIKRVGEKVILILKNGFKYTAVIPDFEGSTFVIVDKFNHRISIDCDVVSIILPYEERNGK